MFRRLLGACIGLAMTCMAGTANSVPVLVNPTLGLDSEGIDQRFLWTALGPIDSIGAAGGGGPAFDPFWELTVAQDSIIPLVTAIDGFLPTGDSFELVFDGSPIAWTNIFLDGSGFFHGEWINGFLTAGTHTFTINVLDGSNVPGGAWLNFSPVTAAPEPGTLALFATGLAGLGFLGWRRRRKI